MLLDRTNVNLIHLTLYGPNILEPIQILIRGDDQKEGTITKYTIFNARRSGLSKRGQAIFGEMSSDHRCTWHIPRIELQQNGIAYTNVLTQIIDVSNRWWEPESGDTILHKVWSEHVCLPCVRIDPPGNVVMNEVPSIPVSPY